MQMITLINRCTDYLFQIVGIRHPLSRIRPLPPVSWRPNPGLTSNALETGQLAERLHSLRPEVSVEDFTKQVQNPIASRGIAIWVKVLIPQLGREMILDSRTDNPVGLPPSIKALPDVGTDSPWPAPPLKSQSHNSFHSDSDNVSATLFGHGGSSCPGMFSMFSVFEQGASMEIPVEVLAFHAEGTNSICSYSVSMYSEVTGRLSAPVEGTGPALLTMWGKMLISIRPKNPAEFGGHSLIQLRSQEYIEQRGTISGFPPHRAGEYVESKGNEVYVGFHPGQRHIAAIVERGRIIFSTDIDDFLQARTRISSFTLLDGNGVPLAAKGPPYDPNLIGQIAGVRLEWEEVRGRYAHATHYRLYRMDPDEPQEFFPIGGMLTECFYVDKAYDGTRSYAYGVVPAFVDSSGVEVQGVSLDYSTLIYLRPGQKQFLKQNSGVGHVRRLK